MADEIIKDSTSVASESNDAIQTENKEENTPSSSAKAGRKGDPRMHRSVSARIADPSISLFDALKIGGFDYPHDNDANVIDSENVTLGQRKNQLSRRVRLVRKQSRLFDDSSESYRPHKQVGEAKSIKRIKEIQDRMSKGDYLSDEDDADDYDQDGRKSTEDSPPDERRLLAKHHPQYQPIIIPQRVSKPRRKSEQRRIALDEPIHEASGVAIASLTQTATTVGLTLEQLAVALQNCRTLTQILMSTSGNGFSLSRQELAVALYQAENNALYQRAMVRNI